MGSNTAIRCPTIKFVDGYINEARINALGGPKKVAERTNSLGQPIGPPVAGWTKAAEPSRGPIVGRFCRIEALDCARHGDGLYDAFAEDTEGRLWTYMFNGPFESRNEFTSWVMTVSESSDPLFYAIVDAATGKALGVAAYMRIKPVAGVIEVGNIAYSPRLQQTALATEAMYLLMKRVFDELGYRRYEWKCDALNAASQKAARRLGFSFDGIFAQALVYKGRNRDTAWYSMLDRDWPKLRVAYEKWLQPENFDASGVQKTPLSTFMKSMRT